MNLTNEQIQTLNDARTILDGLTITDHASTTQARVHERADAAEHAIFQVLVGLHTRVGVPMTEAQLHNGREL